MPRPLFPVLIWVTICTALLVTSVWLLEPWQQRNLLTSPLAEHERVRAYPDSAENAVHKAFAMESVARTTVVPSGSGSVYIERSYPAVVRPNAENITALGAFTMVGFPLPRGPRFCNQTTLF
jgi:hypothetical protein